VTAYLNRTATAGNRKTWTWSGWVKRGLLNTSASGKFFGAGVSGSGNTGFQIGFGNESFNSDTIYMQQSVWGTSNALVLETNAVYRDPSAWYHIVLTIDTTQATDTNRVKLYVNGVQVTSFNSPSYPSQNADLIVNNNGSPQFLASATGFSAQRYFDGYLAEVNFIDGQALTPSSFGSTNALTGVWQPARYTGSYGTNGFYLPFTDNSTAAALGTDFSGNSNTWTVNNISVTAGVTYDSMTDVPTLTNATTANYAVLNPLDKNLSNITIDNGNLRATGAASNYGARATFAMLSGKWYWEVTITDIGAGAFVGMADAAWALTFVGSSSGSYAYYNGGTKYNNGSSVAYGASYTTGDVLGIAYDATAGSLTFYKNNISQGVAYTGLTGLYHPAVSVNASTNLGFNAGQRPFTYTPPSGFVALNAFNLPNSTIVKGNTVMDATLYTGNGAARSITNTAAFQPDLVWIKDRTTAYSHVIYDSVRGVGTTKMLSSNLTDAEGSFPNNANLTAFNSNGFALGTTVSTDVTNNTGDAFVGWQWQAGQGATSSNTDGTITSTVSVNASAGFSVVTYTGTGAAATVGHGLGVAPKMIIVKRRNSISDWYVYHVGMATPSNNTLFLNSTSGNAASTAWNNTSPTSSVFNIGTLDAVNNSGSTYVAYCWSDIAGFSKFGSYTGNGSLDGTFVYLGFRPKYVLMKQTNASGASWVVWDSVRGAYNANNLDLFPNLANAELASNLDLIDMLSNGFKLRGTGTGSNASGGNYIYAAFAESPFRNSLAR
jgi:hypothetical protein